MILLPIPAAPVCLAAPQQGVKYEELKPNAWQKALIEAIQKDGFTVVSSRREKSIWFSIRLDIKKNNPSSGYPISLVLDPGMAGDSDGDGEVPPEVNAVTIVDLSKKTLDEAKGLAEALGKKYPDMAVKVGKYPNGNPNLNLRFVAEEEKQVKDTPDLVKKLNTLLTMIKEVETGSIPPAPEPSDPLGKTLKESKLVFTDIGGFYKLRYDFTDTKRSQVAFIRQRVWDFNSLNVQEVYSIFYESKAAPSTELLQKIFQKSFTIGGLVLEEPSKDQEFWRIRYRIEIPTGCTVQRLKQYLNLVANTGDVLEKELGSEDKL